MSTVRSTRPQSARERLSGDPRVGAAVSAAPPEHPSRVLLPASGGHRHLPVCDHYSGQEALMRKSLQLQAEMTQEFGLCVFDVTLDCEDGAPVGGEAEHANMVVELALQAAANARVAVRVHATNHPAFEADMALFGAALGHRLTHVMLPKVESLADVERAVRALDEAGATQLPLHVLIESPTAVHHAFDIAAHPRVQSLSFGLMDFVSAHGGAIDAQAMTSQGQMTHPLVVRAKMEISAACHAHGKVPAHGVVTEFNNTHAVQAAASHAAQQWGYTRMWSIHPRQIRPILQAFAPTQNQLEIATKIIAAGARAYWSPIAFDGQLHDRASYRYFWQLLERAHQTGCALPDEAKMHFVSPTPSVSS